MSVALTSGSSWTAPVNWSAPWSFDVVGGGGGGGRSKSGGGGGGAYSRITNADRSISAGTVIYYSVGAAGAAATSGSSGGAGGDSWINASSNAAPTLTSQGALAKGGAGGALMAGGAGGATAAGVGAVKYAGGAGGAYNTSSNGGGGGAGGGAGGNRGPGGNGGSSTAASGAGGGGGSGDGSSGTSGTAGGDALQSTTPGGAGGNNSDGFGGGVGGTSTVSPGAGSSGGGGGGGRRTNMAVAGAAGGAGISWGITGAAAVGAGGGGGGGGSNTSSGDVGGDGAAGGSYGGGGGGAGYGPASWGAAGAGAPGIIVITYTAGDYVVGSDNFTSMTNGASIAGRTSSGGTTWSDVSYSGTLSAQSQKVYGTAAGAVAILASSETLTTRYAVAADFEFKSALSNHLIAQYTSSGANKSFYTGGYESSTNSWAIIKRVNNSDTTLASVSYGSGTPAGLTKHLELRVNAGVVTLLIDGVQVVSATDSSPFTTPGSGGVWVKEAGTTTTGVHFDNFVIKTTF